MNNRTVLFVLLSLLFGGIAVFLAKNWLDSNAQLPTQENTQQLVTLVQEVPLGTILEKKHLTLTQFPENLTPKTAIVSLDEALGMVTKNRIYKGEILRSERVTKKGEGSTLASLISNNMRAVTIRVNDVVGVAGFLLPGNRVDILNLYKRNKSLHTDIVLANVKILAIDQRSSNDENKPTLVRAVTLELNLEQAETLMIAKGRGSLQLALRNPNDQAVIELAKLEDEKEKPVPKPVIVTPKPIKTISVAKPIQNTKSKVFLMKGISEEVVKVAN